LLLFYCWGTSEECATEGVGIRVWEEDGDGWCRSEAATGQLAEETRGGLGKELAKQPRYIPTPRPHGHQTHGRASSPIPFMASRPPAFRPAAAAARAHVGPRSVLRRRDGHARLRVRRRTGPRRRVDPGRKRGSFALGRSGQWFPCLFAWVFCPPREPCGTRRSDACAAHA
jgi:hypothetical protein